MPSGFFMCLRRPGDDSCLPEAFFLLLKIALIDEPSGGEKDHGDEDGLDEF